MGWKKEDRLVRQVLGLSLLFFGMVRMSLLPLLRNCFDCGWIKSVPIFLVTDYGHVGEQ
ncbi:hypothetical protein [Roseiconus lacunae]|uniref:Uncharacterized protein n=1 Tax=Roseiconus lacunae TaxID=2605694 RepID=A0ABT7PFU2_9BACT|nr:hypothetical protein [Roseiconus lacunae]MDM4015336.1 hypothetical protein [Roseiconus lacunae]